MARPVMFQGWQIGDRLQHPDGITQGTVLTITRRLDTLEIDTMMVRWDGWTSAQGTVYEPKEVAYPPVTIATWRPVAPDRLAEWLLA